MPDFSLGIGNLYGRFAKDEKQPERRSSGGGQSGSQAFSERDPTPKPIGGPLVNLGLGILSPGLLLGQKISADARATGQSLKERTARTIVGALDPVFGEDAPLDISEPAKAGDYGGALRQLGTNVTEPIVETGKALTLPLLAVAGILLLK